MKLKEMKGNQEIDRVKDEKVIYIGDYFQDAIDTA